MDTVTSFFLEHSGYSVKRLTLDNAEILQKLYEQCLEFALLTDGIAPSPSAARDEFTALPEGKTIEDKYILGLFNSSNILVGMIEAIRHYPDDQTWWIGLMMLAPGQRGKGLGTEFYRAFERWVLAQGAFQVSLSVIEANEAGLQFWKHLGFSIVRKVPPQQFGIKTHERYELTRIPGQTAKF
ncbi:GNAT family N-acetyltransferase [Trichocoleus sp. FACHB-262]|uniref:GNAT family N-acetyltransferase n=1 Tax=Trichocoleus sp. FACHB-262 TaxID=2692869 RepID=UPI001688583D|nr:GNAT family N-acetyltransferase [Trichocoleus sp. FACHB-262]MBD2124246.1 GNAT family N-acetyltransferase [Trichocoleus sp. FACHB-262]